MKTFTALSFELGVCYIRVKKRPFLTAVLNLDLGAWHIDSRTYPLLEAVLNCSSLLIYLEG